MSKRGVWLESMAACAVCALVAWGCGGAASTIVVDVRDVGAASGAPALVRITDLGDLGQLPNTGRLPRADSDGQFVVGELILIEGDDFGKLPTVQIGGRPAAAIARTGGGGIIARIPAGVPTGAIDVEVSHPGGKGTRRIEVMRYAFAVQPNEGKLHVLAVRAGATPTRAFTLDVPHVRDVVFSPDGQAAYALIGTDPGRLAVIVTTAAGGPRLVRELRLPLVEPHLLAVAPSAPLLAAVDGNYALLVDLQDPRTPALHEPFPMKIQPRAKPREIALDPGGRMLAVLVSQANQIVPYDVSDPAVPQRLEPAFLMPEVRHPVLRAFTYSPSGMQLWAVAGDTELSLAAGQQPTQIVPVDVEYGGSAPLIEQPSAAISGAGAPLTAASSRRETVAPGTAIRSTAKTAAVVIATVHPSLLELADKPASDASAQLLAAVAEPGTVLRTDLEGESQRLLSVAGVVTGLAVSHDSRTVAASVTRIVRTADAFQLDFGVSFVPLAGGEASHVQLGNVLLTAPILRPAPVALAP